MAEIENLKIDGGATYTVGNQDIIANEWEASKTYVKGKSYVIQEHRLYVCNTTHTSTNPFDPTNWTEITVGDALGSLNGTTLPLTTNPADGTVSEAIGDLSDLTTTRKDSLVDAVNEVNANHNAKEITYTGNTTSQGFLVSDIDFTTKIRMGYVTDSSSGKYFCILRPSSSYKVVAMVINDNLLPVANASNYTLHIFYSDK